MNHGYCQADMQFVDQVVKIVRIIREECDLDDETFEETVAYVIGRLKGTIDEPKDAPRENSIFRFEWKKM